MAFIRIKFGKSDGFITIIQKILSILIPLKKRDSIFFQGIQAAGTKGLGVYYRFVV